MRETRQSITDWVEEHVKGGKIDVSDAIRDGVIFVYEEDLVKLVEALYGKSREC